MKLAVWVAASSVVLIDGGLTGGALAGGAVAYARAEYAGSARLVMAGGVEAGRAGPPAAAGAGAGAARGAAKTRVLTLELRDDLTVMKIASTLEDELEGAARGYDAVVLRVWSRESRRDVVARMARAVREARVPVIAVMEGGRGSVDPGAVVIGMAAGTFGVSEGASVRGFGSRGAEETAPAETDWGVVDDELMGVVAEGLRRRGVPGDVAAELGRAVVRPGGWTWVSRQTATSDYEIRAGEGPPGDGSGEVIVRVGRSGGAELELRGRMLMGLRLADAVVQDAGAWVKELGYTVSRAERREIGMDEEAWEKVRSGATLRGIDGAIEEITEMLRLPDPAKRGLSRDTYRSAARRAGERLAEVERKVEEVERFLLEYPEMLRTAPPGQTEVGAKASGHGAKWRSMIQSRRDKVMKLREKAEEFAGQ